MLQIKNSLEMLAKAKEIMYPPTQTIAKGPSQFVEGIAPVFAKRGLNGHLFDVDDNEFIDLNMAIGPVSLGYAYEPVDTAIKEQLSNGISFSLMHHLEYDVAKKINSIIPNADVVRFSKTGADVCSAAIRIARAFTKREKVICCGYHGWHDWYISTSSMKSGIPISHNKEVISIKYNDLLEVEKYIDKETAALILEPALFEEPDKNYLKDLLNLCNKNGVILIFDEMWTGFRFHIGGAQAFFNVIPHISVFSKACANGMPLSFITGRSDIMKVLQEDVFFYTTFGGESLSLAAAKKTIEIMEKEPVIKTIWEKGEVIKNEVNSIISQLKLNQIFEVKGYPCRTLFNINNKSEDLIGINPLIIKSFLQQIFLENNILWSGFHNLCYSHTNKDIQKTIATYKKALEEFKNNYNNPNTITNAIKGIPIQPVFRKTKY